METEKTPAVFTIPRKVLNELMKKPEIIDGQECVVFDPKSVARMSRETPDIEIDQKSKAKKAVPTSQEFNQTSRKETTGPT